MKKALLVTALAAITIAAAQTNVSAAPVQPNMARQIQKQQTNPAKEQMRRQFEQRLQLTDKQKEKAKKLHEKGRAEMEPVMKQIKAKHAEMKVVEQNTPAGEEREKKIEQLRTEMKALDKQAKDLRKKNSEDFEKILNKTQKAELNKMKAEGRAKFEREHKARPPFQGLGTQNLFVKPMMAPQTGR